MQIHHRRGRIIAEYLEAFLQNKTQHTEQNDSTVVGSLSFAKNAELLSLLPLPVYCPLIFSNSIPISFNIPLL